MNEGVPTGMEATCYIAEHNLNRQRCLKTRSFNLWGGAESVERRFKFWCMCGHRPSVGSLAQHSRLLESEIDGLSDQELPTLAELELFMPDGVEQTKPLRLVRCNR